MKKGYRYVDKMAAAIHEMATDFHKAGVMSKKTFREIDNLCLTPVEPILPEEIREIRQRECISQAVFARFLNVTTDVVSKWEQGVRRPSGPALKLLTLVKEKGIESII